MVVVTGYRSKDVEKELRTEDVIITRNSDYQSGRVSSVKSGLLTAMENVDAYAFIGVDQPRTVKIISDIVVSHFKTGALITSPRYQGKGGHPVIFSSALRDQILNICEQKNGLREVFEKNRHRINEVKMSDYRVRLDLNTEQDYLSAFSVDGLSTCPID